MIIKVFIDGGARGNPGIAGSGVVITDESNRPIYQESKCLGIKTNNEAEYFALITALTWIRENLPRYGRVSKIFFYSDSELLVRQILGIYKVKSVGLKPLFVAAKNLLDQLDLAYQFRHIPREQNQLADKLANQAMNRPSP